MRNEQTAGSDIVLVEFSEPVGFEFLDLMDDLEKIFNQNIDLVSKGRIRPHYLPYIQEDTICLNA